MNGDNPATKTSPADLLARADALMRKNRSAATFDDDIPLLEETVDVVDVAAPRPDEDTNWDGLCESVYSRVMQQMDLYAEFGLRDRIGREMRPKLNQWVDQFAHELSTELADNIRKFVAQAIEEEVARMRAAQKK